MFIKKYLSWVKHDTALTYGIMHGKKIGYHTLIYNII